MPVEKPCQYFENGGRERERESVCVCVHVWKLMLVVEIWSGFNVGEK